MHPFIFFSAVLYFLVLGRRGVAWERSWTALLVASAVGYVMADLLFMQLYIPNRYTRYSMAVMMAILAPASWKALKMVGVRNNSGSFIITSTSLSRS